MLNDSFSSSMSDYEGDDDNSDDNLLESLAEIRLGNTDLEDIDEEKMRKLGI